MKKRSLAAILVVFLFVQPFIADAADAAAPASKTSKNQRPEWEQLAQTVSMITGVAISPLLGVGAVGAWKYFASAKEEKANLPWYAKPMFFLPALLIVGLVFAKDVLGPAVPTALKKPIDVAEVLENKLSGLVAAGAFVPLVSSLFGSDLFGSASLSDAGFAAIDGPRILNVLLVPFAMIAFVFVFLLGHAINVLILVSPFATVDAALKGVRLALLGSVVGTSFASPMIGLIWASVIILFAWFLSGWTFRLAHFGTVFLWDFFTGRKGRFQPDTQANWMFLAREIGKVPVRSYGKLEKRNEGGFVFTYKPWLVMAPKKLDLPKADYAVGKGLVLSELVQVEGEDVRSIMALPPRYRSHEVELAEVYGLRVEPIGLRAMWRWLKGVFGFKGSAMPAG